MNPWQEHAANTADYLDMLKGDDKSGGATLVFTTLTGAPTVDCTFTRIQDSFDQVAGGQSPKLLIEDCVFLVSQIPAADMPFMRKGLKCTLKPNPKAAPIYVELWMGGLEQGGLKFRFMLRDTNYSA